MKLTTSLLSSLVLLSTIHFQSGAMEAPSPDGPSDLEKSWIFTEPEKSKQSAEEATVFVKNNTKWTIELTYTEQGKPTKTVRLSANDFRRLGKANKLQNVTYGTYGEYYQKVAPTKYTLDFKKYLLPNLDLIMVIEAKTAAEMAQESASKITQGLGWSSLNPANWSLGGLSQTVTTEGWKVHPEYKDPEAPFQEKESSDQPFDPWDQFKAAKESLKDYPDDSARAYRLIFQLPYQFSKPDLDLAYRELSLQYHPDKAKNGLTVEQNTKVMQLINEARGQLEKKLA